MKCNTANILRLTMLSFAACLVGCMHSAGVVFPPMEKPVVWPAPPEAPRIRYVGQLVTNDDLKPGVGFGEAFTRALFGKKATLSMLTPFALCTDGANRVFVADSGAQMVHVFDMASRNYARWVPPAPTQFSQPAGIAWNPAGQLFVSDSVGGCIFIFDTNGALQGKIGEGPLGRPAGLAWDPHSNRLLVADVGRHCIFAFSPDGKVLAHVGQRGSAPGEFNFPTNITVDHQGRVYVSDTLNFRVQQFDANLRPLRSIGRKGDMPGCLSQPKGIAVDSEDHLYVLDSQFEAIQIFDPQGQLLLNFGEEGRGPGQFWLPAGLFIDPHDHIWVADGYNRRIQTFDYLPEKLP